MVGSEGFAFVQILVLRHTNHLASCLVLPDESICKTFPSHLSHSEVLSTLNPFNKSLVSIKIQPHFITLQPQIKSKTQCAGMKVQRDITIAAATALVVVADM